MKLCLKVNVKKKKKNGERKKTDFRKCYKNFKITDGHLTY